MHEGGLTQVELAADDPDDAFAGWMAVQRAANPDNPGSIAGTRARLRARTNPVRSWAWRDAHGEPVGISSVIEVRSDEGGTWHGSVVLVDGHPPGHWEQLVDHAAAVAVAAGQRTMSFGARMRRVAMIDLLERRGGRVTERMRTLELALEGAPAGAHDPLHAAGRPVVRLADRPDLAAAWLEADLACTADIPGETGEQDTSVDDWLAYLDDSPYADRELMWALLGPDDAIDVIVHLERHSIDPEAMEIAMLGVARHLRGSGVGRATKHWLHAHAHEVLGVRRLQTINHVGNVPMEQLNESLGYRQVDEFASYELTIA